MTARDELERARAALQAGAPVVIPTDTVYGIAVRPDAAEAVDAVFRAKKRSRDKPLPLLAADVDSLRAIVVVDDRVERIAARWWPGPVTLVLRRASRWPHDLGAGTTAPIAVRVPDCSVARDLMRLTGALAVTSANLSGRAAATSVDEARAELGSAVSAYVDGGRRAGRPSTIVSLVDAPVVLRGGDVPGEEVVAEGGV